MLGQIIENAKEGIIVIQGDKILLANERARNDSGYSHEQLTSSNCLEFMHPQDRERAHQCAQRILNGESTLEEAEYRIFDRDGGIRWIKAYSVLIEWRGSPAILSFLNEISEQKVAEEKLVSFKRLYLVLTRMNEAIVRMRNPASLYKEACRIAVEDGMFRMAWVGIVDPDTKWVKPFARWGIHEGYIEKVNASTREDLPEGLGPTGTCIRTGKYDICNDFAGDPRMHPWREEGLKRGYAACGAFPLRGKDGTNGAWTLYSHVPNYFNLEEIQLLERVADDLSNALVALENEAQNKEAGKMVAALQAQLLHAQRMEAIGMLAGGVAHDFNNLLTVISTHSQVSLRDLEQDNRLKESWEAVLNATDKAAALTRQLLFLTRREIMEMKTLNLNDLINDLGKMLRRVIREDIELVYRLQKDLGWIKADPGQIEQVILNLVVNARDALPMGGRITIESQNVEVNEEVPSTFSRMNPGRYVLLTVSDNGVGMTPEVQKQIFAPFFTTKEKGKGTGLGLSTVYGVIQQSEGGIGVDSAPGRGTRFRIYLPRFESFSNAQSPGTSEKDLPRGRETILVVEDNEDVRKMAAEILRRQGFHVLEASYAEEAFGICDQHPGPVHLLLTDVVMPRMHGPELARRMGYFYPNAKVLYMSGYNENPIFQRADMDPNIPFIQKPFSLEKLLGKVREILDQ